jgi:3-methyladenine DNA glycosylase AlkD
MIYISVTKVRKLINDILEPVMKKTKTESINVKNLSDKSDSFDRNL